MKKGLLLVLLSISVNFVIAQKISHREFDALLKKYVSSEGKVNYKGFVKDSVVLNKYLNLLTKTPPDEKTWTREDQMCFWINAYNAFTIKLVVQYYPVSSIKDIGSIIQIPFVNTPWDIKFVQIGKDKMDLNSIEHGILRKRFGDPRIHMALVCASKSCPILLNEAYLPDLLDNQLNRQTKQFLASPSRNKISADKLQLSMIFKWYEADFSKKGGSITSFVNSYSAIKIKDNAKISYLDYDWGLNE